jgi:hypothetical protein
MVAGKGLAASSSYISISTLKLDAPSPRQASPSGTTLFNITGRGFDGAACAENAVDVDGVECAVLACSPGALTVLFPGARQGAAGSGGALCAGCTARPAVPLLLLLLLLLPRGPALKPLLPARASSAAGLPPTKKGAGKIRVALRGTGPAAGDSTEGATRLNISATAPSIASTIITNQLTSAGARPGHLHAASVPRPAAALLQRRALLT